MKLKIKISHSRDNMDTWGEGRKTYFIVESPVPLKEEAIGDLSRSYLRAIGANYRDMVYRAEDLGDNMWTTG